MLREISTKLKNGISRKDINSVVDGFRKQSADVKLDDFRDVSIKIPAHINAELPEDKNGFLFDANSGRVYALNRTACFIFRKLKEGFPLSEIVKNLVTHYDVDEGIAVSDIQDFLYQLREFGVGSEE